MSSLTISVVAGGVRANGSHTAAGTFQPIEASREALEFISRINDDDFEGILFDEKLVTVSDNNRELGECTISVTQSTFEGSSCLLVHANSSGTVDGVPCGTSITAFVDKKLETLHQFHHEYVKLDTNPQDKKTFINQSSEGYTIERVITQGKIVSKKSSTFPKENAIGFVTEGANLLLQRLLIRKAPTMGNFRLLALDLESATVCSMTYNLLDKCTQKVEGVDLEVTGIERTLHSTADLPTTWQSYFTRDGHSTSRNQVGSPVSMRLLTLPSAADDDGTKTKPTFGKKPLNLEEDMEMRSKYQDRKEQLTASHSSYVRNDPDLKALLADFVQFLLIRKPDDVLSFAADYFSSFSSPGTRPLPRHLNGAIPDRYPESRSNSKIEHLRKPPNLS